VLDEIEQAHPLVLAWLKCSERHPHQRLSLAQRLHERRRARAHHLLAAPVSDHPGARLGDDGQFTANWEIFERLPRRNFSATYATLRL
jgi:hypothetical protein